MELNIQLISILIGLSSGAFGYWFTTFFVQPILRYRDIRSKILKDFIYFAQVVNADGLNNRMKNLHERKILVNRDSSARLSAAVLELPNCYKLYLKFCKLDPSTAAKQLIGYSNTTDYDQAHKLANAIRKNVGLPEET